MSRIGQGRNSTLPHSPRSADPAASWVGYLSLRPVGLSSAIRLYLCFGLALVARSLSPRRFRGMGKYLSGSTNIRVRSAGLLFGARPYSEDLQYLLPSHKSTVQKWFRPAAGEMVVDAGAHLGFYAILA